MIEVKQTLSMYSLICLSAFLLSLLPTSWSYALGRALGSFIFYIVPLRRAVAEQNVERVYGATLSPKEKRQIVHCSYQTLAIVGIETLQLRYIDKEKLQNNVQVRGGEHLKNALEKKKGVIVIAGHFGNIVACGCAEAARGVPVHVIAKGMHNKAAEKFYFETLKKFGVQRIPTRRSKQQIADALTAGAAVYIAVDQHMPSHRGLVCRFFDQLASTTPAPTRFALETGASIIPCQTRMLSQAGQHEVHYQPEFALEIYTDNTDDTLRENTERINRIIESDLHKEPQQWLWQHKRWKVHDEPSNWDIPKELVSLIKNNES